MHWACLLGHIEIVKFLCDYHNINPDGNYEANMNLQNSFGRIPMEEALQAGHSDIAEFLAPLSELEDGKLYSTITEAQIYAEQEEEDKDDKRSIQSEEAIRNENEQVPKEISEEDQARR